jgi:FixJ family two-component response regulator
MPRPALVLVVEDDELFGQSMKRLMRSLGWPVEVFVSAADFPASARLLETTCLLSWRAN